MNLLKFDVFEHNLRMLSRVLRVFADNDARQTLIREAGSPGYTNLKYCFTALQFAQNFLRQRKRFVVNFTNFYFAIQRQRQQKSDIMDALFQNTCYPKPHRYSIVDSLFKSMHINLKSGYLRPDEQRTLFLAIKVMHVLGV